MAVVSGYKMAKKKTAAEVAAEKAQRAAVGGGDTLKSPSIGEAAWTTGNGLAFEGQGAGQRITSMFGADGKTIQKPSYSSKYGGQIDSILDSILNREDFTYDMDSDPLYQQYKAQYVREGNRAMRDTAGAVAGMTGGYGSSYGATAASQANDHYLSQLNDRVPELHQLAYGKYRDESADLYNRLAATQGLEQSEYGKYRDEMSDYYGDFDRRYREYSDGVNQGNLDREFDYKKVQDALSQGNWDKQFSYGQEQDKLSQGNWEKQFQYQMEQDAKAWAAKQVAGSSGSGGGGSSKTISIPEEEVPRGTLSGANYPLESIGALRAQDEATPAIKQDMDSLTKNVQKIKKRVESGENPEKIREDLLNHYAEFGMTANQARYLLEKYGLDY